MKLLVWPIFACALFAPLASAEIYKYVDPDGHVTYTNSPVQGAKKLHLEAQPGARARNPGAASPADFPKVKAEEQKTRDVSRRRILEDELSAEEKLLTAARQNLKALETDAQKRAAPQQADKLGAAREDIALHEQNIQALKSELSRVK
ncbi:MAG: DUF4124 domain-containing protein [Pseudomonadota bacterium]|jgi:hypothetical protein